MLTFVEENGTRPCCLCGKWMSVYVLADEGRRSVEGVCQKCVDDHDGPGKFQGLHDDDLAKALILQYWANENGEDDYMHHEGYGYCGMFENCLLIEDSSGFISMEEYPTDEKCQKQYDSYFNDGWGASEDDIYVPEDYYNGCPRIYCGDCRKEIKIWPRKDGTCPDTRIDAAIYLHMQNEGMFPNVWDSHRYGVSLRKMHSIPEILQ